MQTTTQNHKLIIDFHGVTFKNPIFDFNTMKINNPVFDFEFCVGVCVASRGSICIELEMKHLQMMQTTSLKS